MLSTTTSIRPPRSALRKQSLSLKALKKKTPNKTQKNVVQVFTLSVHWNKAHFTQIPQAGNRPRGCRTHSPTSPAPHGARYRSPLYHSAACPYRRPPPRSLRGLPHAPVALTRVPVPLPTRTPPEGPVSCPPSTPGLLSGNNFSPQPPAGTETAPRAPTPPGSPRAHNACPSPPAPPPPPAPLTPPPLPGAPSPPRRRSPASREDTKAARRGRPPSRPRAARWPATTWPPPALLLPSLSSPLPSLGAQPRPETKGGWRKGGPARPPAPPARGLASAAPAPADTHGLAGGAARCDGAGAGAGTPLPARRPPPPPPSPPPPSRRLSFLPPLPPVGGEGLTTTWREGEPGAHGGRGTARARQTSPRPGRRRRRSPLPPPQRMRAPAREGERGGGGPRPLPPRAAHAPPPRPPPLSAAAAGGDGRERPLPSRQTNRPKRGFCGGVVVFSFEVFFFCVFIFRFPLRFIFRLRGGVAAAAAAGGARPEAGGEETKARPRSRGTRRVLRASLPAPPAGQAAWGLP